MNKNIDGTLVSEILYGELNKYLLNKKYLPTIVNISTSNDYGNLMYAKMKEKVIKNKTKINYQYKYFKSITKNELIEYIEKLNKDNNINGIMLQLPLADNLKKYQEEIINTIKEEKDIDGLTAKSQAKLKQRKDTYIPCTALGIYALLKAYNISLNGKNITIINRSKIVGLPLKELLSQDNLRVEICHSKTNNLKKITKNSDILIVALNKEKYITKDYIKEKAIIIDVGVHKNGRETTGDVDYKDVYPAVSLITPPTGGVGPMTICLLAYNSVKSIYKEEVDEILKQALIIAKNSINNSSY